MRDKHYEAMSFRLDDEVRAELNKRRPNFKSWNYVFRDIFGFKKPFKMKQKRQR